MSATAKSAAITSTAPSTPPRTRGHPPTRSRFTAAPSNWPARSASITDPTTSTPLVPSASPLKYSSRARVPSPPGRLRAATKRPAVNNSAARAATPDVSRRSRPHPMPFIVAPIATRSTEDSAQTERSPLCPMRSGVPATSAVSPARCARYRSGLGPALWGTIGCRKVVGSRGADGGDHVALHVGVENRGLLIIARPSPAEGEQLLLAFPTLVDDDAGGVHGVGRDRVVETSGGYSGRFDRCDTLRDISIAVGASHDEIS